MHGGVQRVGEASVRLRDELERLKRLTGLASDLELFWTPDPGNSLSGEVKGGTIYVYEDCEQKALGVLQHEFLDYCISQAIEPYRRVTNTLIKLVNDDAYRRKERIVEALGRLLFEGYDPE